MDGKVPALWEHQREGAEGRVLCSHSPAFEVVEWNSSLIGLSFLFIYGLSFCCWFDEHSPMYLEESDVCEMYFRAMLCEWLCFVYQGVCASFVPEKSLGFPRWLSNLKFLWHLSLYKAMWLLFFFSFWWNVFLAPHPQTMGSAFSVAVTQSPVVKPLCKFMWHFR